MTAKLCSNKILRFSTGDWLEYNALLMQIKSYHAFTVTDILKKNYT